VPPVALLPLAVVVPTVKVIVPPVALLPLAGVVPRRRAARCRCVLPVAVVVRPSKSLYCVVQYCLKYCSPLVDGRLT